MDFKLKDIKPKGNNPRGIKDKRFDKLVKSIKEFPKMMNLRPIIYDPSTMEIVGGNMRYRALIKLGYKAVPEEWVKSADDFTEQELDRFVITDNVGFGEWDWDILGNEWDDLPLGDWGLDIPVKGEPKEKQSVEFEATFEVIVLLNNEKDQLKFANEMKSRGLEVQIP